MTILINYPKNFLRYDLIRDVTKHVKRGHRWIFSDCFASTEKFQDGPALVTFKKQQLAFVVVQKDTHLRARIIALLNEKDSVDYQLKKYFQSQWSKTLELRAQFPNELTNSFRFINGEGDGFPGLIVDIYNDTAVIKHDHPIMEEIWNHQHLVEWLKRDLPYLKCIYLKRKNDEEEKGVNLFGELAPEVSFKENGVHFTSNIRDAAKTGFFLDQRDNRKMISHFSKNKKVLNLFSYTGGFSVYAAIGGASEVTSVDIAAAAVAASQKNFDINKLKNKHNAIHADAFEYLETAQKEKKTWDIVITDPPSFAPNQKALPKAIEGYTRVYASSIKLVPNGGLFVASSCSSHLSQEQFLEILQNSFSTARRRGTVVYIGGQPSDHPFPLVMSELRYLKFAIFRLDD